MVDSNPCSVQFIKDNINYGINSYFDSLNDIPHGAFEFVAIVTSIIAMMTAILASIHYYKLRKENKYRYLADLYNQILNDCLRNPDFLDIEYTESPNTMTPTNDRNKYSAFCYKAWSLVDDIIEKGLHKHYQFKMVIHWITAYHYEWLKHNPLFFYRSNFWDIVDKAKNTPHLLYRYKPLPQKKQKNKHGEEIFDIDWGEVSPRYHELILGPFHPLMIEGNHNSLLEDLKNSNKNSKSSNDQYLDLGCGPGNLLPHIKEFTNEITGIDKSSDALQCAKDKAISLDITFHDICWDYLRDSIPQKIKNDKFDIIISVNSILPNTREDVTKIYRIVNKLLSNSGKFYAILPSYDTTEHLQGLWKESYESFFTKNEFSSAENAEQHTQRIIKAFRLNKKVPDDNPDCLYADDGSNLQCYHTKEIIEKELLEAGLRIIDEPKKIYYPWNLTCKFDYGDFSNSNNGVERIWDWYIIANKH